MQDSDFIDLNNKSKSLIRKKLIDLREKLSPAEVAEKSTRIAEKLFKLNCYINSKTLMGYMNFRNEVITEHILEESLKKGKRVVIPRIDITDDGTKGIVPYEIKDIENDVERGTFGVREPDRRIAVKVNPEDIDLIIIPGVGFDARGYRIGFGAGYYDRFLKKISPHCHKVALAFEFQVLEKLPEEEHDIPVDIIITEKRIMIVNQTERV